MASDTSETTKLKAALYRLICAAGNWVREDRELVQVEDDLHEAILHLQALRAWQERAVPLLRAMVEERVVWCERCQRMVTEGRKHKPDCPVTQARALLAESEASDAP